MGCVNKLTHQVMLEEDEAMACAAHFLSGMAKALVEDVVHGMAGFDAERGTAGLP
ncbi:hypothetical protein D3C85_1622760 [compost metagenome]